MGQQLQNTQDNLDDSSIVMTDRPRRNAAVIGEIKKKDTSQIY